MAGSLDVHDRVIYNSDHELFRSNARRFFREELETNIDQWEKDGALPREFWLKAGKNGFHCSRTTLRWFYSTREPVFFCVFLM